MLGLALSNSTRPGRRAVNPIPDLDPFMWLDASSVSGFEEEDPVDTVPDLSGNGNDGNQPTLMQMPWYIPNAFGGRPGLLFDGVDDWIPVPITSGVAQYFAVIKSSTATWNGYWGIMEAANLAETHDVNARWGLMSQGTTQFHNDPPPDGVRKNGVDLSSPFDCGTITSPMILSVKTRLGGVASEPRGIFQLQQVFFGHGLLAELVAFNTIQSPENTADIEAYLARKYGITLS